MKTIRASSLILQIAVAALLGFPLPGCKTAQMSTPNTACIPVPRDDKWVKRHEGFVAIARTNDFDLLFMGDSITDFWRNRGKAVWDANFAPMKAANFGISADRTQHVLWRIENGELDGAHPKLVVLMIGTNNTQDRQGMNANTPEEIAQGITAILKEIRRRCPASKVLLLGVFPRTEAADSPDRAKIKAINGLIAKLDNGKTVKYLDIGGKFLDPDGTLPKSIMPDSLHPNEKGYQIWADAIMPTVRDMMQ